jgi:tetratricopeptide (TPR) repeat protein
MTVRTAGALAVTLVVIPLTAAGQRAPLTPALLADRGWVAIEEKRFGDALEAFAAAAKAAPGEPTLYVGLGLAAFMLGRNAEARGWLERALTLDPGSLDASMLLGEVHYRAGRLKEAIAVYETAAARAPSGADELAPRLDAWRKEARLQDGFYQSKGAHFEVLFEGPADEALARRAVELLEAAYWRIGSALGVYPADPILVVLYTQEQFRDITRLPDWVAGAYDGRIRVPARGVEAAAARLEDVLAHEFTHALVASIGGRGVPVWLHEGLASVLEPGGARDAPAVLAAASVRLPLSRLQDSFSELPPDVVPLAYAQSAVAVRRMIDLRGTPAVVALLRDLGRGSEFPGAFQLRMAMRYEDFESMTAR